MELTLDKLNALSSESIVELRDLCSQVLTERNATGIGPGALAWFSDRSGSRRVVRVMKKNPKTVICAEVDPITFKESSTTRWKVSASLLHPMVDTQKHKAEPSTPVVTESHAPTTIVEDAW